jgi:hypothetical protein
VIVKQVTRSVCWLPPGRADWYRDDESSGDWSRTEETWRLIGRIGYRVTTENFPAQSPARNL